MNSPTSRAPKSETKDTLGEERSHRKMRIYFGFTVAGDRSSLEAARAIAATIRALGHEILTSHLLEEDAWQVDRGIPPQEVYRRDMGWLSACDMFVAEVSGSSFGLGFETGYLLGATEKRVILFYQRDVEHRLSLLITGNTHPHCTLVCYSGIDEIDALVRKNISPPPR